MTKYLGWPGPGVGPGKAPPGAGPHNSAGAKAPPGGAAGAAGPGKISSCCGWVGRVWVLYEEPQRLQINLNVFLRTKFEFLGVENYHFHGWDRFQQILYPLN